MLLNLYGPKFYGSYVEARVALSYIVVGIDIKQFMQSI